MVRPISPKDLAYTMLQMIARRRLPVQAMALVDRVADLPGIDGRVEAYLSFSNPVIAAE
jgi:hypothetical protein